MKLRFTGPTFESTNPKAYPDRWWQMDCGCRTDGPWTIYGPAGERVFCTLCGGEMTRTEVR